MVLNLVEYFVGTTLKSEQGRFTSIIVLVGKAS